MTQTVDRAILEDIATANRILFHQGVVDAFGHISLRHPHRPDHFLLSRNMAPGSVTADDILELDAESEPVDPDGPRSYLERFIHGEIYRVRPDVMSVVHSHSASVVPFGVVKGVTLRPVCHMSGFLGRGAPVFEIRCCAGDNTDMLIRDRRLGMELAKSLGDSNAVLMRGHGSTVVADTLQKAVYRAVYAEVNAKLQADAMRLGEPIYLTPGEADAAMATTEGQWKRPWDLWASQARAASGAA
jgi:HCOMODA/2-hydroxy-3-carboxy-muconic semialdehyde decarboxylase